MSPRRAFIITLAVLACVLGGYLLLRKPAQEITAATPPIDEVVDNVLAARTRAIVTADSVPFGEDDVVNVLLLGIDSRKEGKEQHCDAIHMASVNVSDWTVRITSVPRGTYAYIPPGNYSPNEYYIANACGYAGLDYGIDQIERVIGVQADYIVTAGFSQVLGSLRALNLPTTSTLQWLRHRQSYQIGDPQRSHNQAVFVGDLLARFATPDAALGATLQYVLYTFVETDMDFGTARALYEGLAKADMSRDGAVTYDMKPFYETVDYHLDLEDPDAQIAALLDRIRPYLSKDDLSDRTLGDVQAELVAYLRDALTTAEGTALVVDEETWRQVEDDAVREELHYAFIEAYATAHAATDNDAAVQLVADYILEKQTLGLAEWEEKGRALLATVVLQ